MYFLIMAHEADDEDRRPPVEIKQFHTESQVRAYLLSQVQFDFNLSAGNLMDGVMLTDHGDTAILIQGERVEVAYDISIGK